MNLHKRHARSLAALISLVIDFREHLELGIDEFNAGRFFECHDTFEELWMAEHGERRRFLQGLIQAAVGIFHASRNNVRGAESQIAKSMAKLAEAPGEYLGIDVAQLHRELEQFLRTHRARVGRGEPGYDADDVPRIIYKRDRSTSTPEP